MKEAVRPKEASPIFYNAHDIFSRYCSIVEKTESSVLDRLAKYHTNNESGCLAEPMAWAFRMLTNKYSPDLYRQVATNWMITFADMDAKWKHHPRYQDLTSEMKSGESGFFTP
jgi:hypothetical protein